MAKKKPKKKLPEPVQRPRDFLDSIAPAAAKFNTDHFTRQPIPHGAESQELPAHDR